MSGIKRVKDFSTQKVRLMVEGNWLPSFDIEIHQGGFDILELHRGEYEDFSFLVPHAEKIQALWINAPSKSSKGLEKLRELRLLSLSYEIGKDINFAAFPKLTDVSFDAWYPWYENSLFANQKLEAIRIEGYDKPDCAEFGKLSGLRKLVLAKGRVKSLEGLRTCMKLEEIQLAHLRQLDDISEVAYIPTLLRVELNDVLPKLVNFDVLFSKAALEALVIVGPPTSIDNIRWLEKFRNLEILRLQIPVEEVNWDLLFTSPKLRKVVVMSAKPLSITEDEIRAIGTKHNLRVSEVTVFGTKKKPSWLIELAFP
ncbi:MAG: leucine-rich repeat domain-containing protein [Gallionella sp.]